MSPFRIRFAVCSFAVSMMLSPLCAAHDVVPPDWCVQDGREPEIVARFDFDGPELNAYMHKCGIVEANKKDGWHAASEAVGIYCEEKSPQKGAVPFVSGPETYLTLEHHATYRTDQGIKGVCAVCPPKKP